MELVGVESDGGPFLILPSELQNVWDGGSGNNGTKSLVDDRLTQYINIRQLGQRTPVTDYDVACCYANYSGSAINALCSIPVGNGNALVIHDDLIDIGWMPSQDFDGGVLVAIVEWPAPDDDDDDDVEDDYLIEFVSSVPKTQYTETGFSINLPSGSFLLLAAVDSGPNWVYENSLIELPSGGSYRVLTSAVIREEDEVCLYLHALQHAT